MATPGRDWNETSCRVAPPVPSVHRDGHLGAALLAFAPVGLALAAADAVGLAAVGAGGAVVLVMLPDYDMRIPLVAHRGVTHTLLFAAVVGLVAGAGAGWLGVRTGVAFEAPVDVYGAGVASLSVYAALVATLTVVSHLAADALTPAGVPLFWPVSDDRVSLGVVRADNTLANYGLLVAGALATLAWAYPLLSVG